MELQEYRYKFEDLDINTSIIEKFIGYAPGESPEPIPQMIREVMEVANNRSEIKGGYIIIRDIEIDRTASTLKINGTEFQTKKIITGHLRKAEAAALFVCTAGQGIGDYSKELMHEGDMLKGYIADVVGSEVVEAAMDKIQNDLEEQVGKLNLKITDRYSPGYCDWNVNEQHKLFSFFPENFCGISLTPSSLMQPIKSISGIIGIGHELKRNNYACNHCDMVNCLYREKRLTQ